MAGILLDDYHYLIKSSSDFDVQLRTRNIPKGGDNSTCNLHDVVDSISSLSKIAPTFGQIGGEVQFELPYNVSCLIRNGFLKEIFW